MPNLWLGRHYDSVHHGLGRNWLDDERPAATSSGRWKTTEALLCGPMFLPFGPRLLRRNESAIRRGQTRHR